MIETGIAPVGDTRIHYQAAGEGPGLLFLHAGIADSRMWRDQMGLEGQRTISLPWTSPRNSTEY